jgi:vancomycin resistance protein YoaR
MSKSKNKKGLDHTDKHRFYTRLQELMSKKRKKKDNVQEPKSNKSRKKFWLFFALMTVAILAVAFGGYSVVFSKKAFMNVKLGDWDLGGKSRTQISATLSRESEQFLKNPINIKYQPLSDEEKAKLDTGAKPAEAKDYQIMPSDIGLSYDIGRSVDNAMNIGRGGSVAHDFWQQLVSLVWPQKVEMSMTYNPEALTKKISEISAGIDQPEKDFALKYENGQFVLTDASEKKAGFRVDQEKLIGQIKNKISNIKNNELTFKAEFYEPKITEKNAQKRLAEANQILNAGDLNLKYEEQNFALDKDTISGMVSSRPEKDDMKIYLTSEKVAKQVSAVAAELDRESKNAVLSASGTSVTISQMSESGRKLDQAQTIIDIENAIFARVDDKVSNTDPKVIRLRVDLKVPDIDANQLTAYGLKELVASGTTSFAKSPSNRIHNIAIGAGVINGTLIKPGEEFSTLNRLGTIDASTGYLPELVIKNNKTIPEYGGGLCQVSTTLFRAALNAGMKITARQNHAYRVSYYEPPIGMDATIYDPAPDFKFVNNYNSHILVQSRIVGSKITFEFYGTKDTRVVEQSQPEMFDVYGPGNLIEVQSDTLPAGERQLLEKGHQGASAKFHYKVSRDGVVLQETDFLSKYVAIPEKWLVGTASAPAPDPAAIPAAEGQAGPTT